MSWLKLLLLKGPNEDETIKSQFLRANLSSVHFKVKKKKKKHKRKRNNYNMVPITSVIDS